MSDNDESGNEDADDDEADADRWSVKGTGIGGNGNCSEMAGVLNDDSDTAPFDDPDGGGVAVESSMRLLNGMRSSLFGDAAVAAVVASKSSGTVNRAGTCCCVNKR